MNSNKDNRAAGDTFPPLPKVNSLQALTRLRPKNEYEWGVFAFVLNRDMIKPDKTLDELHAVVFHLGAFSTSEKADEHAKNIISITGHPGVISAKYGFPIPLTTKFDPSAVTEVPVDMKGRIIELESSQYKQQREDYEKRIKQERDVMKEAEDETDPDNIEHFKRQCYLAIKNRASFQVHSREADTAWKNYKTRETSVRDHFHRHPEHEAQWLPYLKEKLIERGELDLYQGLENAYKELREELLGLNVDTQSTSEDHSSQVVNSTSKSTVEEPKIISTDQVTELPSQPIITSECPDGIYIVTPTEYASSVNGCSDGICMVAPFDNMLDSSGVDTTDIEDQIIQFLPSTESKNDFPTIKSPDKSSRNDSKYIKENHDSNDIITPEDLQCTKETNPELIQSDDDEIITTNNISSDDVGEIFDETLSKEPIQANASNPQIKRLGQSAKNNRGKKSTRF
jgi:hypothetical protein